MTTINKISDFGFRISDYVQQSHIQIRNPQSAIRNQLCGWWRRYGVLVPGLGLIAVVLLGAMVGTVAPPHDPIAMDIAHRLQPPSLSHPFGTDQYGRDVFSRVLSGASVAVAVGLVSVGIAVAVGVPLGAVAGFRRGWLGEAIMRAMDALFAFPSLLLAIAVIAALGPSHIHAMLAIGAVNIPVLARITHGMVLGLREKDFVLAARAMGATERHILWRHVLRNALSSILVQSGISFAGALLADAGLSYLGLGTQPPLPSWGLMLEEARTYMGLAPWMAIFPGLAIATAILGFNLLSDGLRDYLDPDKRG
ncbi:MAG: ABC transporter permease [Anaerolineae bacterium]